MSSMTAEHMRWHADDKYQDGKLRHPRDRKACKEFDHQFPSFSADPRNVRLGLSSDGFNPYGNQNSEHSIWLVVLIPYNLPPWMCMKQSSFILSMIIPGKKSPGNDIDVYLQPLISELSELWNEGVETYDSFSQSFFTLRAALMWTVCDFLGLSSLSSWNTYTALACPKCNFDTEPLYLKHSRKNCFMGHRRFLELEHKYRLQRKRFDGKKEKRPPPKFLSGSDILDQLVDVPNEFGKPVDPLTGERVKKSATSETRQWHKVCIFFLSPLLENQSVTSQSRRHAYREKCV